MLEVVIEVHNITGTIHLQGEREDAVIVGHYPYLNYCGWVR